MRKVVAAVYDEDIRVPGGALHPRREQQRRVEAGHAVQIGAVTGPHHEVVTHVCHPRGCNPLSQPDEKRDSRIAVGHEKTAERLLMCGERDDAAWVGTRPASHARRTESLQAEAVVSSSADPPMLRPNVEPRSPFSERNNWPARESPTTSKLLPDKMEHSISWRGRKREHALGRPVTKDRYPLDEPAAWLRFAAGYSQ